MTKEDTLGIVIPVYNEEGAIAAVLDKWIQKLDGMNLKYQIHAYNDGSKDDSSRILADYAREHAQTVVAHDKLNSGHGPTILLGYCENADAYTWLFQIDSDDEMGPELFDRLWAERGNYDFLVGIRDGRVQPLPRKVISFISRCVVKVFYGRKTVWDVNTPYRLMRSSVFGDIFGRIPRDTFAPNVILSGMVARRKLRYFQMRIPQRDRQTGEVSIKKWKLLKAAMKSFRQTIVFALGRAGKE